MNELEEKTNQTTTEPQEQVMVEKNKRELFFDKLKERYPDLGEDEDEIYNKFSADYDNDSSRLKASDEEGKKLLDLFDSDPRIAELMQVLRSGENPMIHLLENFGDDFKTALDDPENAKAFAEAHQKYLDKVSNDKSIKKRCADNTVITLSVLQSLQEEQNLTDEQIEDLLKVASDISVALLEGTITKETFLMVSKALNYDNAVAEASEIAEIKGRNSKIDLVKKQKDERLPTSLSSSAGGTPQNPNKTNNPFMAD